MALFHCMAIFHSISVFTKHRETEKENMEEQFRENLLASFLLLYKLQTVCLL